MTPYVAQHGILRRLGAWIEVQFHMMLAFKLLFNRILFSCIRGHEVLARVTTFWRVICPSSHSDML